MNAERRKSIVAALAKINEGKSELETARDDEQDYFDNMPEGLQQGEKGEKAEAAIETLTSAIDAIESAVSEVEENT